MQSCLAAVQISLVKVNNTIDTTVTGYKVVVVIAMLLARRSLSQGYYNLITSRYFATRVICIVYGILRKYIKLKAF